MRDFISKNIIPFIDYIVSNDEQDKLIEKYDYIFSIKELGLSKHQLSKLSYSLEDALFKVIKEYDTFVGNIDKYTYVGDLEINYFQILLKVVPYVSKLILIDDVKSYIEIYGIQTLVNILSVYNDDKGIDVEETFVSTIANNLINKFNN